MNATKLELNLEVGYPATFKDDHNRCVSLNGSHGGVEYHSVIIFRGSLEECKKFVADFYEAEI